MIVTSRLIPARFLFPEIDSQRLAEVEIPVGGFSVRFIFLDIYPKLSQIGFGISCLGRGAQGYSS